MPVLALLLISSTALVSQTTLMSTSAQGATTTTSGGFGPLPSGLPIESRCQDMTISTHIVFVGQWVIAKANGGICGVTGKDNSWSWPLSPGPGVKGCQHDATSCEFKATASTDQQLEAFCITGANVQGGWESCDYYGVVGDNMGIIDGHVLDKDGGPVSGATISAYGHPGASTTSDADGFYAMQVNKGSYQVAPSGGPLGKASPSYTPKVATADVHPDQTTHLDFTLDTSVELKLAFGKTTVDASGYEVVNGTVTTTQYGKPLPNVQVQLTVQPTQSADQAVTAGPRAAVCQSGNRVWPTGSLNEPSGYPVTVTTDSTGKYEFQVNVGTTPGTWTLDAWAFNSDGKLSTDVTAASDTKSIDFKSTGSNTLAAFVADLDTAARATSFSTALANTNGGAANLIALLSADAQKKINGVDFAGLGFGLAGTKTGQVMVIFPADKPPVIDSANLMQSSLTRNADDLVFDPAIWTGTGLPANGQNLSSLPLVLSKGLLTGLPTVSEYESGKLVSGWKTVKGNTINPVTTAFQEFGWGYPNTTAGACF
jgi:hypothetical protein